MSNPISFRTARSDARIFLLLAATLLIPLGGCGLFPVHGSGNIMTENRPVADFTRVVFYGMGKLLLTQGEVEALSVTADDNLLSKVESEIRGDTLYIGFENGEWGPRYVPSQPVRFVLSVQEISSLDVLGLVSAETGALAAQSLEVHTSGVASLQIDGLRAETLSLHLSGKVSVEVSGAGEVARQEVHISGNGTYEAPELKSRGAAIDISGSGAATVWATDSLDISTAGVGSISYFGSPVITQQGSGNANLYSLGSP